MMVRGAVTAGDGRGWPRLPPSWWTWIVTWPSSAWTVEMNAEPALRPWTTAREALGLVREPHMLVCFGELDVRELLAPEHEATEAAQARRSLVAEIDLVAQEGDARPGRTAEIVAHFPGDDHLDREAHDLGALRAVGPEQLPRVASAPVRAAHPLRCLHDRMVGQERKEAEGGGDVGLADPVRPGDARERPKLGGEADQVLETVDFQAGQHRRQHSRLGRGWGWECGLVCTTRSAQAAVLVLAGRAASASGATEHTAARRSGSAPRRCPTRAR